MIRINQNSKNPRIITLKKSINQYIPRLITNNKSIVFSLLQRLSLIQVPVTVFVGTPPDWADLQTQFIEPCLKWCCGIKWAPSVCPVIQMSYLKSYKWLIYLLINRIIKIKQVFVSLQPYNRVYIFMCKVLLIRYNNRTPGSTQGHINQ